MTGYETGDFDFDLRRAAAETLWTTSGWSTAALVPGTVCGVGACYAPPYAAPGARLAVVLEADGVRITDTGAPGMHGTGLLPAGGTWRLDGIERRGTYHRRHEGHLVSLEVRSELTPLHGRPGYALRVTVRNRSERALTLRLLPELTAGPVGEVPLSAWGWMPPEPETGNERGAAEAGRAALAHGPLTATLGPAGKAGAESTMETTGAAETTVETTVETASETVGEAAGKAADVSAGEATAGATAEATADATAVAVFELALLLDGSRPEGSPGTWAAESRTLVGLRTARALERVPRLVTDVPELDAYYRRSLAAGLVCLWDNPAFATVPFPATSGIDGGALCAYAWDTGGYAPHTLALMLGPGVTGVLEAMLKADLTDHYAIAPDGSGTGVAYAYSGWSLVMLAHAAACHDGIGPDLVARLAETEAQLAERFPAVGELRDYGAQHNLLEMRSTGWEHVVASPNAERAWSLDLLADLAEHGDAPLQAAPLRARAERILGAVAEELWDAEAGWFRSRYPDGHTELAYSVQAFDALRAGACTPSMAVALLAHLRDGAFLGPYGVSSVSAEDRLHYELGDVDWSGGGAYTGEAPQLALTLWERHEPRLAWDVLRRVLWMGGHFPYFPQDHYCDRPAAPPRGRRANVIAGLTGAEAVLLGLIGLRPQVGGALDLAPPDWLPGTVELHGLRFRGHDIDVKLSTGHCEVSVDGHVIRTGTSTPLRILGEPDE